MCGLAGIYARRERPSRELLLEMAGELRHRGPDGAGLYLDGRFGMANTRLAIVDLEGGDQPISDERGRFWVMQNGEIYNYVELRDELEQLGHVFSTHSDTEVIAQAYEHWGREFLHRLNGDFALAVWDRERQELFLARDRFGVRPLFLASYGGDLCFASEAKALLRHPAARRELDPAGIVDVFTLWSTLPDRSAFAGIRELPPAHCLVVTADGAQRETRWWDLDFSAALDDRAEQDVVDELHSLLDDSVRLRLRADVPVATYLSGGLDSSLLAALAARQSRREQLSAFGVGFANAHFDESAQQDEIARHLDVGFHRTNVDAPAIADVFPRVIELAEQPLLRTAPAPLLRLSASVRAAGLKVVLTGEGADELFGGYDIFREDKVRRFWARDPESTLPPAALRAGQPLARDRSLALGRHARQLLPARPPRRGRSALQPPAPVREHRALRAPAAPGLRRRRRRAAGPARAADEPASRRSSRASALSQGSVPRGGDAPRAISAARAGRPDADGELDRGPLSLSRLPGRRVRGGAARSAAAARAARRSTCCEARCRSRAPASDRTRGRSGRIARRSADVFAGREAPPTWANCSGRSDCSTQGCSSPTAVAASQASSSSRTAGASARRTRWRSSDQSR